MRVNFSPIGFNFKGNFWATSDTHAELPAMAKVLTEIENEASEHHDKTTFINAGDIFMGNRIYSPSCVCKLFTKFTENNPKMNKVFGLGNVEIGILMNDTGNNEELKQSREQVLLLCKNMQKNGAKVISAAAFELEKRYGVEEGLVLPYVIIKDIVDDEEKNVLVVATTGDVKYFDRDGTKQKDYGEEKQRELLENVFNIVRDRGEEYDEVILISHNYVEITESLVNFLKNDLGVGDKLKLSVGGHTHIPCQKTSGKTEIIYPPSHGKGATRVRYDKYELSVSNMDIESNVDTSSEFDPKDTNDDYVKIINEYKNS